jgi:hypothetical protein
VSDEESLELWEELALSRTVLTDTLKIYDATQQIQDPAKALAMRAAAGDLLRKNVDSVRDTISTIIANKSRIDGALLEFKLAAAISDVVMQVTTIAREVFGDGNDEQVKLLADRLRTETFVPDVSTGTEMTPASAVKAMIESVPSPAQHNGEKSRE